MRPAPGEALDELERRPHVDGEVPVEGLHGRVEEPAVDRLGVAEDEARDRAELALDPVEDPLGRARVHQVGLDRVRASAGALDGLGDPRRVVGLRAPGHARVVGRPVREGDVPAAECQVLGDGRAEPRDPADARDQRDGPDGRVGMRGVAHEPISWYAANSSASSGPLSTLARPTPSSTMKRIMSPRAFLSRFMLATSVGQRPTG